MSSLFTPRSRTSRFKVKHAEGMASRCSSRVAKSGKHAHSFHIGQEVFSIFSEDDLSPVIDGDIVRFEYEVRHLRSGYRREYFSILSDTLVISAPIELSAACGGHVYVLSNPSMPGLMKVGFTTDTVVKRAEILSGVTSIPTSFQIEWSCPVLGNARAVEKRAHAHLAHARTGKEFFRVSLGEAKAAVIRSFAELYPEQAMAMDAAFKFRAESEMQRRQALAELQARKEAERAAEKEQAAFDLTREGQWRKNGSIVVVLAEWRTQPVIRPPSFIAKLLGGEAEDYVEVKMIAGQRGDVIEWQVSAIGRLREKSVHDTHTFATETEAFDQVAKATRTFAQVNKRVSILVPNRLIENPPKLPERIGNTTYILPVSRLDGLTIRPTTVRSRRRY